MLRVKVDGRELKIAAYVLPGQAAGTVACAVTAAPSRAGWPRRRFNTYALRTSRACTDRR